MTKVVLLPLDERPCNYTFPYKLFNDEKLHIVRPEKLGNKKQPADCDALIDFLLCECADADYLVLSIDTLLYGGLIPSRLHFCSQDVISARLQTIRTLKKNNPKLKIYAFQVIMRCPKYSSSDEEPDYYGICGEQIHSIGSILHQQELGLGDGAELPELYEQVTPEYLADYTDRRKFNLSFNLKTLDLVQEGLIDFLIIPQDDSAPYGYTAMDQRIVRTKIAQELLQDVVLMYPGADEITLTILSRVVNELHRTRPRIFIRYASVRAPYIIPSYEDRMLGETLKYHILAAGCRLAYSVAEADLILAVNCPSDHMEESVYQPSASPSYCVERNLTEFLFFIEDCVRDGKPVTVGDIAYANGADLELIALMDKRQLLDKVAGYAGWNTSANTLGTAIAQGVEYLYRGRTGVYYDFLAARYVEDAGYCSVVRKYVGKTLLPGLGMDYFDVREAHGEVSVLVKKQLEEFVSSHLSSIADRIEIHDVYMPWRRMFEVGVDVSYRR